MKWARTWNLHEFFHMKFMWSFLNEFHINSILHEDHIENFMWNSCEVNLCEIHVKYISYKSYVKFIWISHELSCEIYMLLISYEFHVRHNWLYTQLKLFLIIAQGWYSFVYIHCITIFVWFIIFIDTILLMYYTLCK